MKVQFQRNFLIILIVDSFDETLKIILIFYWFSELSFLYNLDCNRSKTSNINKFCSVLIMEDLRKEKTVKSFDGPLDYVGSPSFATYHHF